MTILINQNDSWLELCFSVGSSAEEALERPGKCRWNGGDKLIRGAHETAAFPDWQVVRKELREPGVGIPPPAKMTIFTTLFQSRLKNFHLK